MQVPAVLEALQQLPDSDFHPQVPLTSYQIFILFFPVFPWRKRRGKDRFLALLV